MASPPPLSSNTITTFYSTAPSICHIFPNKTQISLLRNRVRGSCKATINSDQNHVKFDGRRNALVGLGGLALANLSGITRPFGAANAAETSKKVALVQSSELPIALDSVISVIVERPRKSRSQKEKEEEEEVLVIEGVEFVADKALVFDVHVNDDENSLSRPDKAEFAGSLVFLPQYKKKVKTSLHLGITDLLEQIGADDESFIKVTLVPSFFCSRFCPSSFVERVWFAETKPWLQFVSNQLVGGQPWVDGDFSGFDFLNGEQIFEVLIFLWLSIFT